MEGEGGSGGERTVAESSFVAFDAGAREVVDEILTRSMHARLRPALVNVD